MSQPVIYQSNIDILQSFNKSKSNNVYRLSINGLPREILIHILRFISLKDLYKKGRLLSKEIKVIIENIVIPKSIATNHNIFITINQMSVKHQKHEFVMKLKPKSFDNGKIVFEFKESTTEFAYIGSVWMLICAKSNQQLNIIFRKLVNPNFEKKISLSNDNLFVESVDIIIEKSLKVLQEEKWDQVQYAKIIKVALNPMYFIN
jgi:hypothetical protein